MNIAGTLHTLCTTVGLEPLYEAFRLLDTFIQDLSDTSTSAEMAASLIFIQGSESLLVSF